MHTTECRERSKLQVLLVLQITAMFLSRVGHRNLVLPVIVMLKAHINCDHLLPPSCFLQKMGHFVHINDLRKVAGISLSVLQKNSSYLMCSKHQLRVLGGRKFVQHTDSRFAAEFHHI